MTNRPETGKGSARIIRVAKRSEAEIRNQNSQPDKRRAFWRERGFTRQSQAANLVKGTVGEINEQAAEHKQRAADWPLIPVEVTAQLR